MALRRYLSRSRAAIYANRLFSYMAGSPRYLAASDSVKRCVDALHTESADNVSLEDAVMIFRAESSRSPRRIFQIVQEHSGSTVDNWGMFVAEAELVYDRYLPKLICCYRGRDPVFHPYRGWRCPS